tara:strand:- start:2685 stop:3152 length:468 start_codon:yes stop_codon:yes gene_type:complete
MIEHYCGKDPEESEGYGVSISSSMFFDDNDKTWWSDNVYSSSRIFYCPFCGEELDKEKIIKNKHEEVMAKKEVAKTIDVETLVTKRQNQIGAIKEIARNIDTAQSQLQQHQQSLQLNQGALLQLNMLLGDLGVDVSELDNQAIEGNVSEVEEATE